MSASDNIPVAKLVMKQTAVYWPPATLDEYGRPSYGTAVEIGCRWEDVSEQFVDPEGEQKVSKAKLMVDRDLSIKGILWLGALDSNCDESDPWANDGAKEIRLVQKTPDFKGKKFLREVYL